MRAAMRTMTDSSKRQVFLNFVPVKSVGEKYSIPLGKWLENMGCRRGIWRALEIAGGNMKYIGAYLLGVPGALILVWFLFNHAH